MLHQDDIAAVCWFVFGVWVIVTQFEWSKMSTEVQVVGLPYLLYEKKEEIVFFVSAVYQIYQYWESKERERAADNRNVEDTLNVSINGLYDEDDHTILRFRTLQETPPATIFADSVHSKRISELADRTTIEQPFLCFEGKNRDQEISKILCNYLSARSADGHLAKDMGLPVKEQRYVFGMTNEKFGGPIAFKLRLMVIREDVLRNIYQEWVLNQSAPPTFEAPPHANRWKVLLRMATMFCDEKDPEFVWMRWNKVSMVARISTGDNENKDPSRRCRPSDGDDSPGKRRRIESTS